MAAPPRRVPTLDEVLAAATSECPRVVTAHFRLEEFVQDHFAPAYRRGEHSADDRAALARALVGIAASSSGGVLSAWQDEYTSIDACAAVDDLVNSTPPDTELRAEVATRMAEGLVASSASLPAELAAALVRIKPDDPRTTEVLADGLRHDSIDVRRLCARVLACVPSIDRTTARRTRELLTAWLEENPDSTWIESGLRELRAH